MERICEILNEKSSLENPENPVIEMKDGSVEFENVNFAYAENSDERQSRHVPILACLCLRQLIFISKNLGVKSEYLLRWL